MVDENLRRQYLAAMGIPLWLARGAADRESAQEIGPQDRVQTMDALPATPLAVRDGEEKKDNTSNRYQSSLEGEELLTQTGADLSALGWDDLQRRVAQCRACPELVRNRSRTVFGVGNRNAELMVIGEAPGMDEDRQGEPFVGRAGQLLNRMLRAMGLGREQVFIANILKCRPPNNRDPHQEEALCCEAFLLRQLELVQPEVILSVGRISAHNLLKTDTPVGRLRGCLHYYGEARIPVVVTYHPAYLLRSPDQKAKAWQDLQMALKVLKQRL